MRLDALGAPATIDPLITGYNPPKGYPSKGRLLSYFLGVAHYLTLPARAVARRIYTMTIHDIAVGKTGIVSNAAQYEKVKQLQSNSSRGRGGHHGQPRAASAVLTAIPSMVSDAAGYVHSWLTSHQPTHVMQRVTAADIKNSKPRSGNASGGTNEALLGVDMHVPFTSTSTAALAVAATAATNKSIGFVDRTSSVIGPTLGRPTVTLSAGAPMDPRTGRAPQAQEDLTEGEPVLLLAQTITSSYPHNQSLNALLEAGECAMAAYMPRPGTEQTTDVGALRKAMASDPTVMITDAHFKPVSGRYNQQLLDSFHVPPHMRHMAVIGYFSNPAVVKMLRSGKEMIVGPE